MRASQVAEDLRFLIVCLRVSSDLFPMLADAFSNDFYDNVYTCIVSESVPEQTHLSTPNTIALALRHPRNQPVPFFRLSVERAAHPLLSNRNVEAVVNKPVMREVLQKVEKLDVPSCLAL